MKNRLVWTAVAGLALCLALPACSNTESSSHSRASDATRVEVVGTVLDRATGTPVAGARVTAPGGREVRTDDQGRFQLADLEPGLSGEVVARAEDGRDGRVSLRPLRPGRLEVVLSVGR